MHGAKVKIATSFVFCVYIYVNCVLLLFDLIYKQLAASSFLCYILQPYLLHGAESFLRSQPVNFAASQEIPRIYGTRKFLTIPTSSRHLSLS
jgi:hypothetical protein